MFELIQKLETDTLKINNDLIGKIEIESNRISNLISNTAMDMKQLNELIENINIEIKTKQSVNTLFFDWQTKKAEQERVAAIAE